MAIAKPGFFPLRTVLELECVLFLVFVNSIASDILLGTHVSVSWVYIYKGNCWVRGSVHLGEEMVF